MRTLVVISKACGEWAAFCPRCGGDITDEMDVDDYVGSNCVLWCLGQNLNDSTPTPECREHLLCLTHRDILKGGKTNSCVQRLMYDEACQMAMERGFHLGVFKGASHVQFTWKGDLATEYEYYSVGVLELTHVSRQSGDDGDDDCSGNENDEDNYEDRYKVTDLPDRCMRVIDPPVTRFADLRVSCDHDGIYLWYRGRCTECRKEYRDKIWGD